MKNIDIVQILICILSSSFLSIIVSTIFLDPIRERRKYIFDEKKRVYDSIIIFAQIFLYPKEAKFSLGVERYDIQELSYETMQGNALNDLKMSIPKLKLITRNQNVVKSVEEFIKYKNEEKFDCLVDCFQKDLYKYK